jgi:hypothetical protein
MIGIRNYLLGFGVKGFELYAKLFGTIVDSKVYTYEEFDNFV